MIKSTITILLAVVMLFSVAACGNDKNNNGVNDGADTKGINGSTNSNDPLNSNDMIGRSRILDNDSNDDMIMGTDMGSR